ncbi:TPA: hypothetical protein UM343_000446 [Stenotrophomonas maltophilia]|nr:hypothetical protein [Stenotrophomonas maltophilia]
MSLASVLLVLASAQSLAVMPAGQALSEKESDIAAKAYMSANGVSLDTAKRRLEVESELPSVIAELKRRYRDRLAFVSIENMPDQHLVVGLKGNMMEAARHFSVSDSSIRVEFEEGYPYTEKEFSETMHRVVPLVVELIPDAVSVDGRPELGMIDVSVRGADVKSYEVAKRRIEESAKLKVNIIPGRAPFRNSAYTAGGAILTANGRMCTSGLAVRHKLTKVKGLLTAAHCDDQLLYSNYGHEVGGPQVMMPLTFQDALFDGSHDVQWHSLPAGNTPLQEVFAELKGEYQTKALILIHADLPLHGLLCFRGARSGFSCGTVTSVQHAPLGVCGAAVCAPTWGRVEGSELACASGDSGAAVFNKSGSGYGIVKSAENPSDSIEKGSCKALTVMPFGKVADLNLDPV